MHFTIQVCSSLTCQCQVVISQEAAQRLGYAAAGLRARQEQAAAEEWAPRAASGAPLPPWNHRCGRRACVPRHAMSTTISATIDGQHEGEASVDLAGAYLEYRYMHRSLKNADTTQSAGAGQRRFYYYVIHI